MGVDLTKEALAGYDDTTGKCPHMWSSPAACAWRIGQWMRQQKLPIPAHVSTSRGETFNVRYIGGPNRTVRWRPRLQSQITDTVEWV